MAEERASVALVQKCMIQRKPIPIVVLFLYIRYRRIVSVESIL